MTPHPRRPNFAAVLDALVASPPGEESPSQLLAMFYCMCATCVVDAPGGPRDGVRFGVPSDPSRGYLSPTRELRRAWVTDDPAEAWEILQARDLIPMDYAGRFVCAACGGRGRRPAAGGVEPCPACGTTGTRARPPTVIALAAWASLGWAMSDDGVHPGIRTAEEWAYELAPGAEVAWCFGNPAVFWAPAYGPDEEAMLRGAGFGVLRGRARTELHVPALAAEGPALVPGGWWGGEGVAVLAPDPEPARSSRRAGRRGATTPIVASEARPMRVIREVKVGKGRVWDVVALPGDRILSSMMWDWDSGEEEEEEGEAEGGTVQLDVWSADGERLRTITLTDDQPTPRVIHADETRVCLWGNEEVRAIRFETGADEREWGEISGDHTLAGEEGDCATRGDYAMLPHGVVIALSTGLVHAENFPDDLDWEDDLPPLGAYGEGLVFAADGRVVRHSPDEGYRVIERVGQRIMAIAGEGGRLAVALSRGRVRTLDDGVERTSPLPLPARYRSELALAGAHLVHLGPGDSDDQVLVGWEGDRVEFAAQVRGPSCLARGPRTVLAALAGRVVTFGASVVVQELAGLAPSAAWTDDERAVVGTHDGRLVFLAR